MKKPSLSRIIAFSLVLVVMILLNRCKDDPPDRDQFLGVYSVVETCGNGNDTYDITISVSSTSDNAVVVYNLWDWEENATATINGNSISIPSQLLDGITFSGTGTVSGNTLTISLSVNDGIDSDNCNLVCTRK